MKTFNVYTHQFEDKVYCLKQEWVFDTFWNQDGYCSVFEVKPSRADELFELYNSWNDWVRYRVLNGKAEEYMKETFGITNFDNFDDCDLPNKKADFVDYMEFCEVEQNFGDYISLYESRAYIIYFEYDFLFLTNEEVVERFDTVEMFYWGSKLISLFDYDKSVVFVEDKPKNEFFNTYTTVSYPILMIDNKMSSGTLVITESRYDGVVNTSEIIGKEDGND